MGSSMRWIFNDVVFSSQENRTIAFKFDNSTEWFYMPYYLNKPTPRNAIRLLGIHVGAKTIELHWLDDVIDKNPLECCEHKVTQYHFTQVVRDGDGNRIKYIRYWKEDIFPCTSVEWRVRNLIEQYKEDVDRNGKDVSYALDKVVGDLQEALVGHK